MSSLSESTMQVKDAEPSRRTKSHVKDPVRYKTVLCNKFEALGKCPYGPRCQFAHGILELRDRRLLKPMDALDNVQQQQQHALAAPPQITPPPSPRCLPSLPPLLPAQQLQQKKASPITEDIERSVEADAECMLCDASCDVESAPPLHVDKLSGQVMCRRDASITTQSVRRTISFLFDDAGESGAPVEPFHWPWSGVDMVPIERAANVITAVPSFLA